MACCECPYVKKDGSVCGRWVRAGNEYCSSHRPKPCRQTKPCSSCGKPTWRPNGLCLGPQCGLNEYYRDLRQRRKAEAAERAREAEEEANQDICAAVMDDYVADLIESFDASTVRPVPPPPPAAWRALSSDAQSELMLWIRQAIEADRRDAHVAPAHAAAAISSH